MTPLGYILLKSNALVGGTHLIPWGFLTWVTSTFLVPLRYCTIIEDGGPEPINY